MTIEKIFHIHQPVEETKNRLSHLWSYRHHLPGMTKAWISKEGEAVFAFSLPGGFTADLRLEQIDAEHPNQILFRSSGGNVDMVGMLEFVEVGKNLTEVELTLNYELESPWFRSLDHLMGWMDGFLNRQLDSLRSHFQGIAAPHGNNLDALCSRAA